MRLAIVALGCAAAFGLSGCHQILRVSLGGDDPPVHPVSPARPADAGASPAASPGRAFSGRAEGRLASKLLLKHGFVKSKIRKVRFAGDFTARLTGTPAAGDEALGPLRSAQWHGQFDATRNRATRKITLSGLVLATFTDAAAGRACLRLSYRNAGTTKRNRSRRRGGSRLKVLGGEGGALRLAGSGKVRVKLLSGDRLRVRGRIKTRRGRERPFTPACTRLAKKFALPPVP